MKKLILITFLILMNCLKNNPLNLNKINYKNGFNNKITKLIEDYLEAKKNSNSEEAENYLQELKDILQKQETCNFQEGAIPDLVVDRVRDYTLRKISNDKGDVLVKPNYGFENLDNFINNKENYNKFLKSFIFRSWFEIIDLNEDYIEVLLEAGVSINMENAFGENLLHKACYEGDLDLATFLIEKGIDVNKQDRRLGFSPIFFCLKNFKDQSLNIIEKLIEAGASLLIIDNENKTILHHFYKPILTLASKINKSLALDIDNYKLSLYYNLINFFKISLNTILDENPNLLFLEEQENENAFYAHFFDLSLKDTIKDFLGIELRANTLSENFFYDHISKKNRKSFIDFLVLLSSKFFDEYLIKKCLSLYKIKFEEERLVFENKLMNLHSTLDVNTLVWQDNKVFFKCLFEILEQDNIANSEMVSNIKIVFKKAIILKKFEIVKMLLTDPYFSKFNLLKDIGYVDYNMRHVNPLNCFIEFEQNELFEIFLPFSNVNLCDDVLFEIEGDANLNTNPLSNIIKRDNIDMFDLIIKREDLNLLEKDHIGYTCFHYAAEFNRLEMFEKLIELLKIKIRQNLVSQVMFMERDENIECETSLTIIDKKAKRMQYYQNFVNYINSLDDNIIKLLKNLFIEIKLENAGHLTYYESLTENSSYFNIGGVKKSNFNSLKKIMERGNQNIEKFWLDYRERFPLHYSIAHNNTELFNNNLFPIWFDSEANQDWDGKNPLHIAVEKSDLEAIKKILNLEYDLESLIFKNREIKEIYKNDPSNEDLNIENLNRYNQDTSPFNRAIDLQNVNIIALFINYLTSKEVDEKFKINLLDYSLFNYKFESFKTIYESISEANKREFSQQILISIIKKVMDEDKNPKIIDSLEFLLKYYPKENINLNSKKENNPLFLAIEKENKFLIEFLISHGANLRLKINRGIPIAYHALYKKNKKFINKIFEMGAFSSNTSTNDNPLHFCIQNIFNEESEIDEDFFRFIIEKFKDCINQPNDKGFTPLHYLMLYYKKHFLFSEILIQNDMNVNKQKQDENGNTLLHILLQDWIRNGPNSSLKYCSLNIIKELFEVTDMNLKNAKGKSCADYLRNKIWEKYGKKKKYVTRFLDKDLIDRDLKNKIKELRKLIEEFKK